MHTLPPHLNASQMRPVQFNGQQMSINRPPMNNQSVGYPQPLAFIPNNNVNTVNSNTIINNNNNSDALYTVKEGSEDYIRNQLSQMKLESTLSSVKRRPSELSLYIPQTDNTKQVNEPSTPIADMMSEANQPIKESDDKQSTWNDRRQRDSTLTTTTAERYALYNIVMEVIIRMQ